MHRRIEDNRNNYRPRIIVWRLTPCEKFPTINSVLLSQHEILSIIDSIARLSKPIIIFTGSNLSNRCDLFDIVGYGNALGLKMIVELYPEELTDELLKVYRIYGSRVFRLIIDNCVVEDIEARFTNTGNYIRLEKAIQSLREYDYEIHLSCRVLQPDLRKLAFNLDYAFRNNVNGLYCHLRFDKDVPEILINEDEISSLDEFIGNISEMKSLLPSNMYFSPHCIRYSPFPKDSQFEFDHSRDEYPNWIHFCMAGRTFGFISEDGKVYVCSGMCKEVGDMRENNYNFVQIWSHSSIIKRLREISRTCVQTRLLFKQDQILYDNIDEITNEKLGKKYEEEKDQITTLT
ncbi:MAG: hypothetical protein QME52_11805 [Bacteroidota bacterium]|nr:hypothetical protein [Bacteroidota bacterium]